MSDHVLAIDQGTTSTRAILFDRTAGIVAQASREHRQLLPAAGWVGHDAVEIRDAALAVLAETLAQGPAPAAIGITNQRETTVVWDRATGEPIADAIVWQDTRTQALVDALAAESGTDRFREKTGLPLSTYFSATKARWLLDEVEGARERAEAGELLFGTMDTWLLWNLTGGPDGGVHVTDVTNASRTQLMDLRTLQWDAELLEAFGVPAAMLPRILPSIGCFGAIADGMPGAGTPIAGVLGDQQAATFGQSAFRPGEAKNTYGTGNFLIVNTGEEPVHSRHGLLTTVAYQREGEAPRYALEGSVAVTGSLVQWLRDNLGLIDSSSEIEALAASVEDCGGAYIVPAFSGLFAPHWRPDARGVIVGLTRYVTKAHLARAALEATAFQSREVIAAAEADTGVALEDLRVDGGMVVNGLLMQFQADLLGIPVLRPTITETTALGAAFAAGLAVGLWADIEELASLWQEHSRWEPRMSAELRAARLASWDKAVERTLGWVETGG